MPALTPLEAAIFPLRYSGFEAGRQQAGRHAGRNNSEGTVIQWPGDLVNLMWFIRSGLFYPARTLFFDFIFWLFLAWPDLSSGHNLVSQRQDR